MTLMGSFSSVMSPAEQSWGKEEGERGGRERRGELILRSKRRGRSNLLFWHVELTTGSDEISNVHSFSSP